VLPVIAALGSQVLQALNYLGETTNLHLRTLVHILRRNVDVRTTVRQLADIGVSSLPVSGVTLLFSGMVFAYHIADQASGLGAREYVGWAVAETMCRELGPTLTAMVVAARAGSAMAAELGTMKVTEQIDALRTMATDPVSYLVVPRYIAAMLALPMLILVGDVIGITGGFGMSSITAGMSASEYFGNMPPHMSLWTPAAGMIKGVFFGIIIAIVSCHQGLTCAMASEEVGRATTRAVVYCIILVFASDIVLTVLLYP